jgi:carbon-monoxide dehydrogenase large subunit
MSETQTPVHGLGHSLRRKEDDRFIRGKGTYVDDVQLPGMLHMAVLRSPLAHARSSRARRSLPWWRRTPTSPTTRSS